MRTSRRNVLALLAAGGAGRNCRVWASAELVFRSPPMSKPHVVHAERGQRIFPAHDPDKAGKTFTAPIHGECYRPDLDVVIHGHTSTVNSSSIHIWGGRHVRWIGGHYVGGAFRCNDQFGSVFIEGVHMDQQGVPGDAFVTRWHPEVPASVGSAQSRHGGAYFQTCRIDHVRGRPGLHGDGIQAQSATGFFVLEQVTIGSNEQAVFIPNQTPGSRRDSCYLRRVNTRYDQGEDSGFLRSYWFYDGDADGRDTDTEVFPWTLREVWADDLAAAPQSSWAQAVFPQYNMAWGPTLERDAISEYAQFPPELQIDGIVRKGQPPGGDFVSPDMCGLNYVSPHG